MVKMTGGEALVKSLVREGVEVVFGIPGIHLSGIITALRDEPGIRMITTRHEAGATHMADGYARASGKPGVALVVPGAGVYNAASGVTTAFARSSPLLLIAGQIPREQIGKNRGTIHEVFDQAGVMSPVTKWRRQVLRPKEVPGAVTEAFRQMRTGRPRPVLLDVPPEVAVEREELELLDPVPVSRKAAGAENLREAARVIAQSQLPIIFAGGGVALSDAEEALVKLAEVTNIPVLTSGGGKGAIPNNHPLCYGSGLSPAGERHEMNQLYEVMQSAEVVIGIGSRFSLGNPAGESSTLVNINIDENEISSVQPNTIPLHGDARATIEALLPFLKEAGAGERPSPKDAVSAARRLIAYYDIGLKEPQFPILEAIKNSISEETFTVWDVTQFGYYSRTHYQVNHPKTYIDSGYSLSLGFSFPTAMGAKVAKPERPAVCVIGDGGFMFNAAELSTAVQYGINVITIAFRDDAYGNVGRDLEEMFDGTYETDLLNPDLVKFAESFGAVGMRADHPQALESRAPVVIDVPCRYLPLPRAMQHTHLSSIPWTQPQDGLIAP